MTKYEYPELDEVLYRDSLPNGLQIAVVPRRGFEKKIAYLVTGFGSIHTSFTLDGTEYTVPGGVAHYLEHKMFELPGGRDVSGDFAALVPALRGECDLPVPDPKAEPTPETLERVFDMGNYCFQKATFFHQLHHFPAALLTALLVCSCPRGVSPRVSPG